MKIEKIYEIDENNREINGLKMFSFAYNLWSFIINNLFYQFSLLKAEKSLIKSRFFLFFRFRIEVLKVLLSVTSRILKSNGDLAQKLLTQPMNNNSPF